MRDIKVWENSECREIRDQAFQNLPRLPFEIIKSFLGGHTIGGHTWTEALIETVGPRPLSPSLSAFVRPPVAVAPSFPAARLFFPAAVFLAVYLALCSGQI